MGEGGAALRRLIAPDTASLRFHLPGGWGGREEGAWGGRRQRRRRCDTRHFCRLAAVRRRRKKKAQRPGEETLGNIDENEGERSFGGRIFFFVVSFF